VPVPTIEVDTSVGLDPDLEAILGAPGPAEDPPS